MRIGVFLPGQPRRSIDTLVDEARRIEASGVHTLWTGQLYDYDALTLCALLGRETTTLELGTWVLPSYPRHPAALAQQAMTAQVASDGRLALGIGLSHKVVIEKRLGLDYSRPVGHMREYLQVLAPLLRGEPVKHAGELFRVRWQVELPGVPAPPLLVAALGPQMLRLTGRLADGAAIWLGSARYLEEFALPILRGAASEAGRPPPRVITGLPLAISDDAAAARAAVAAAVGPSAGLPSYQGVLERGGASAPEDVGVMGDERAVEAQLDRLEALGLADFHAVVCGVPGEPGSTERALELLGDRARRAG